MRLGDLQEGTFKIETVRIAEGCPEACDHCGAYDERFSPEDLRVREALQQDVEACLTREVEVRVASEIVRMKLVDLFNNYVTTDVNSEPLRGDGFLHLAQLVKSLSDGRTRVVCVSHGLRTDVNGTTNSNKHHREMKTRLQGIVEQMDEKDAFILSMDFHRSQHKIDHEVNLVSYVATLDALYPALAKGSRVTVSLQGDDNPTLPDGSDNPLFRGRVYDMFKEVKNRLKQEKDWTDADIMMLHIDANRATVAAGRAAAIPGLNPANECAVIPDAEFVERALGKDHTLRGNLNCFTGEVFAQANNPGKSYGSQVRGKWERLNGDDVAPTRFAPTSIERGDSDV